MQPSQQPAQVQVQEQLQQQPPQYTQPAPPVPPKSGGIPKVLVALIGLLILVGIGFGVFTLLSRSGGGESDEASLTWWGNWEDVNVINPIIESYKQEHPNVEITYQYQAPQDYRERLANSLAQGRGPDIFRIHNTWVPMFSNSLSTIPEDVMSTEEYEQTFYRAALDSVATNKGLTGIPLMFDGLGLFINQDIFTTFGIPNPDSWNELREAAKDLTLREGRQGNISQAGIALGSTKNIDNWEEIIALMMVQNGANLSEPSDTNSVDAYKYFFRFRTEDLVWDETLPNSVTAFATGQVAMIIAPVSKAYEIRKTNPGLKFRVISVPQLPKFNESEPDVTYASFWVESVNAKSKNAKAAWEFLKYVSSRENILKLQANQASSSRVNKEMSPRIDMRDVGLADPNVSGLAKIAPTARIWYLASNTHDGETGLNTQLSNLFKNAFVEARDIQQGRMGEFGLSVRGLLAQYGLATPPPPPEE